MIISRAFHIISLVAVFVCSGQSSVTGAVSEREKQSDDRTVHVAGSGLDYLTTALIHSKVTTPTGMTQRSTEIVELKGDLTGRVLYHVTSVFDFVNATLVNTGDQVYSGTIAGSEPVMIHDDEFRFQVNLATGEESGNVYLVNRIAGPKVRCTLHVTGTGLNADGNPTFDYTGDCTFRGR